MTISSWKPSDVLFGPATIEGTDFMPGDNGHQPLLLQVVAVGTQPLKAAEAAR